ncbi:uncharacterized protein ACOB8E_008859 isoform 2-T4 [Sarcophilus harrisii]
MPETDSGRLGFLWIRPRRGHIFPSGRENLDAGLIDLLRSCNYTILLSTKKPPSWGDKAYLKWQNSGKKESLDSGSQDDRVWPCLLGGLSGVASTAKDKNSAAYKCRIQECPKGST